jgi:hypothetical protein
MVLLMTWIASKVIDRESKWASEDSHGIGLINLKHSRLLSGG